MKKAEHELPPVGRLFFAILELSHGSTDGDWRRSEPQLCAAVRLQHTVCGETTDYYDVVGERENSLYQRISNRKFDWVLAPTSVEIERQIESKKREKLKMAKTIAFLISMTSAVGIRDEEVLAAYNTEEERDAAYAERKNKAEGLYFCSEIVVDLDKVAKDAIAKLTPVERLALLIPQKEHFK